MDVWVSVNNYDLNKCSQGAQASRDDVLLTIAASRGHVSMIELLLQHGADPNVKSLRGQTALYIGAQRGHENAVAVLLEHGKIDPSLKTDAVEGESLPETAFEISTKNGRPGCCKLLLEKANRQEIESALLLATKNGIYQSLTN